MANISENQLTSKEKKVFYFPHDFNARSDEKMINVRMNYGIEGYGIYFILIECLAEARENRLKLSSINAIAYANQCDASKMMSIACEFDLFRIEKIGNEEYFYSPSLDERLSRLHARTKSASFAAKKRWENKQEKQSVIDSDDANAMRTQCERNAEAMHPQSIGEESRVDKSKLEESREEERRVDKTRGEGTSKKPQPEKIKYLDFIYLTEKQITELPEQLGRDIFEYYAKSLDDYLAQGVGKKKYTDHGRVISNWARRDKAELRGPFKPKYFKNQTGPPLQQQNAAQRNQAHNAEVLKNILEQDGYEIK